MDSRSPGKQYLPEFSYVRRALPKPGTARPAAFLPLRNQGRSASRGGALLLPSRIAISGERPANGKGSPLPFVPRDRRLHWKWGPAWVDCNASNGIAVLILRRLLRDFQVPAFVEDCVLLHKKAGTYCAPGEPCYHLTAS